MKTSVKYISKDQFYKDDHFIKINHDIDICLELIIRLVKYNRTIWRQVSDKLNVPTAIVDYRVDQFGYFDNTLMSIYYSCYSLKNIFETSTFMNFKGISNTLGRTFNNQRAYITFNAIVKMSSIFEFVRKEYARTTSTKKYFDKMADEYSEHARAVELLNNFRNTIHNNGKWGRGIPLIYDLREGKQEIKKGEAFVYDHWKLYRLIKDSITFHKILALNNDALKIRLYRSPEGEQQLAIMKTELGKQDWNNLLGIAD